VYLSGPIKHGGKCATVESMNALYIRLVVCLNVETTKLALEGRILNFEKNPNPRATIKP
jgi:hypothetical protein